MSKTAFDKNYIINTLNAACKEKWQSAPSFPPEFLPVWNPAQQTETEKRLEVYLTAFENQLNQFPHPFSFPWKKRKWKNSLEQMIDELLLQEPLLETQNAMSSETICAFKEEIKAFLRLARSFDSSLTVGDMGQAVRNYIVYAVFLELNKLPQRCTFAIFGYSMLYPYTDNYIDKPDTSRWEKKKYNQLISDKIQNKPYTASTVHDKKTVRLLSCIEETYKRPDDIFSGLLLMLEAQKDSLAQSHETPLTEEAILTVSVFKGGLSVLIDRYFINKPFTEGDFMFYYGFGFLLQLCDDLQDIKTDKESGNQTVFSICRTENEVENKINRLLHYTRELFDSYSCANPAFKEFLYKNSCLLILSSAAGSMEFLSEKYLLWIEAHFPISLAWYQNVKNSFSSDSIQKNEKNYMRMIDLFIKK